MATYYSDLCGRRGCVYRIYDVNDDLLYVGMSTNPAGRYTKHAYQKPWWEDVERIEETWYNTRREALDAEAVAIRTESPWFNVMGRSA